MNEEFTGNLNRKLTKEVLKNLFREAIDWPESRIILQELDCSKSFARQPTNKTFEEVWELVFNSRSHFTLYLREGLFEDRESYWELCGSTISNFDVDYFLYVYFPKNKKESLDSFDSSTIEYD